MKIQRLITFSLLFVWPLGDPRAVTIETATTHTNVPPPVINVPLEVPPLEVPPPDAPLPDVPSQPYGFWRGEPTVDLHGGAGYRLPLQVPPGRRGIEPRLSIAYSSNAGYGSLGQGWQLEGFSRVHRCDHMLGLDGEVRAIQFDSDDRLCLDGSRLVRTHERDQQVEMRTERDTFVKVVGYRASAAAPFDVFEVHEPSGLIRLYGSQPATRQAGLGRPRAWLLEEVRDRFGNTMTFEYEKVAVAGHSPLGSEDIEAIPRWIHYTANGNLAGNRVIELSYDALPEPVHGYGAGAALATTRRLREVRIDVDGARYRTYFFEYEVSAATGRTLLAEVRMCDGSSVCLPEISFEYSQDTADFSQGIPTNPNVTYLQDGGHLVDVDGDGRADHVYRAPLANDGNTARADGNRCGIFIRFSRYDAANPTADPFESPKFVFASSDIGDDGSVFEIRPLDFDRDGRQDLVLRYWASRTSDAHTDSREPHWQLLRSVGDTFAPMRNLGVLARKQDRFADFDGDGLVDVLHCGSVSFGNGSTTSPGFVGSLALPRGCEQEVLVLDRDGDGACEIHVESGGTVTWYSFANRPSSPLSGTGGPRADATAGLGDFNGDGLLDVLSRSGHWVSRSTGRILVNTATGLSLSPAEDVEIADFNNDGRSDVARSYASGVAVHFATAGGFASSTTISVPNPHSPFNVAGDVDGNGTPDLMIFDDDPNQPSYRLFLQTRRPDLLERVYEGNTEPSHEFAYQAISNAEAYGRTLPAGGFPSYVAPGGNAYVVDRYWRDAGPGHPRLEFRYKYEDARIDLHGRGWVGFAKRVIDDLGRGRTTVLEYDLTTRDAAFGRYPYGGIVKKKTEITIVQGNGGARAHVTETEHELDRMQTTTRPEIYYPYARSTTTRTWVLAPGQVSVRHGLTPATWTDRYVIEIDDFGNEKRILVNRHDFFAEELDRTFINDQNLWSIRMLDEETITSTADGLTRTRYSKRTWDTALRVVTDLETRRGPAGSDPLKLTTTYTYDIFGNVSEELVLDQQGNARSTQTLHDDPQKMFATTMINAVGHVVEREFHPAHGQVRWEKGPEGQITQHAYDGFGRRVMTVHPDQTVTTLEYGPSVAPGISYTVTTSPQGAPPRVSHFDRLDREVLISKLAFDGSWITRSQAFDRFGRRAMVWNPQLPGVWTLLYDELDRVTHKTAPDGAVWFYSYDAGQGDALGRETTGTVERVTNPRRLTGATYKNGQGLVEETVDAAGSSTLYRWGPFDQLREVEDAQGNVRRVTTDAYGLRTELDDPDLGLESYTYTAFGELETVTDGNGDTATFEYDAIGRRVSRTESSGAVTTWEWDTAAYGTGLLAATESPDGHRREFAYDSIQRPSAESWIINGDSYTYGYSYDPDGRLALTIYPSASDGAPFAVAYEYRNGHLRAALDAYTGQEYWRRDETDSEGRTVRETFGNGLETTRTFYTWGGLRDLETRSPGRRIFQDLEYEYDANRNVTARIDHMQWMHECIEYDDLDRITASCLEKGVEPVRTAPNDERPRAFDDRHLDAVWKDHEEIVARLDDSHIGDFQVSVKASGDIELRDLDLTVEASNAISALNMAVDLKTGEAPGTQSYQKCLEMEYDALGNITYRSDVGYYWYETRFAGAGGINATSRHSPHAVSHITAGTNVLLGPPQITYDSGGQTLANGRESYEWTPAHKVRTIARKDGWMAYFEYDADGTRVLKETPAESNVYAGPFQRRMTWFQSDVIPALAGESTESHYFVRVEGHTVAEVVHHEARFETGETAYEQAVAGGLRSAGALEARSLEIAGALEGVDLGRFPGSRYARYFHEDHLGSVAMVSNESGAVIERRSYNVWGQLRSSDWVKGQTRVPASQRPVGFTGHEEDEEFGLVNMGGRIYDPRLGRFTSADPIVQAPLFSQSLNRYSYVFNNPLNWTDPSGFSGEGVDDGGPGASDGGIGGADSGEAGGPAPVADPADSHLSAPRAGILLGGIQNTEPSGAFMNLAVKLYYYLMPGVGTGQRMVLAFDSSLTTAGDIARVKAFGEYARGDLKLADLDLKSQMAVGEVAQAVAESSGFVTAHSGGGAALSAGARLIGDARLMSPGSTVKADLREAVVSFESLADIKESLLRAGVNFFTTRQGVTESGPSGVLTGIIEEEIRSRGDTPFNHYERLDGAAVHGGPGGVEYGTGTRRTMYSLDSTGKLWEVKTMPPGGLFPHQRTSSSH